MGPIAALLDEPSLREEAREALEETATPACRGRAARSSRQGRAGFPPALSSSRWAGSAIGEVIEAIAQMARSVDPQAPHRGRAGPGVDGRSGLPPDREVDRQLGRFDDAFRCERCTDPPASTPSRSRASTARSPRAPTATCSRGARARPGTRHWRDLAGPAMKPTCHGSCRPFVTRSCRPCSWAGRPPGSPGAGRDPGPGEGLS